MEDTRYTNSEEEKRESGVPGGGKGRKDEVAARAYIRCRVLTPLEMPG